MFQIGKGDISTAPDQERREAFPADALKDPPMHCGNVDFEVFGDLIERETLIDGFRVLHCFSPKSFEIQRSGVKPCSAL